MGIFSDDESFKPIVDNIARNRGLYANINLPDYLQYSPELFTTESTDYQTIGEDPLVKSRQMQALQRMAGLAETGLSEVDAAGFARARDEGNQMARAGTQSAIQDAQNRGVAGSGMEFAMREIANQGGAQRAQQAGLDVAANAAKQRALYNTAYADQLGSARDQDFRAGSANTGIINQFNQANTNQRNQTNMNNVNLKNDAFKYNEGLKDRRYDNQIGQADRMAGLNDKNAEARAAQAAAEAKKRSAMAGMVGTGIGAVVGGPAGAQVGGSIGSSLF
jgi:hypothetical protein